MPEHSSKLAMSSASKGFGIWDFKYSIMDARGRRVSIATSPLREYWRHAYRAHRRMDMFVLVTTTIVSVVAAFYLVAFCFIAIAEGSSAFRWLILLVPIAICGWRVQSFRRFVATEIVHSRGFESRCFGCRYDLKQTQLDADGCTVCPECGAAWKLNAPLSERVPE